MRIVAGQSRGRKLFTPKSNDVRPTSDRVRQALYNILGSMYDLTVLDLFAGSGALGLEAISRGAAQVVFVDSSYNSIQLVKRNVDLLDCADICEIWKTKAEMALKKAYKENMLFDLILIDPPYKSGEIENIIKRNLLPPILKEDGRVVLETAVEYPPELGSVEDKIVDRRKYGSTELIFLDLNIQERL